MSDLKIERLEDLLDAERRMVRKLNEQLEAATARADAAEDALETIKITNEADAAAFAAWKRTEAKLTAANARADAAELADNRNADPVILHDMELMDRRIEELESQLTTETARADGLQAKLKDALSGLQYIYESHGKLYGVGWDRLGIPKQEPTT